MAWAFLVRSDYCTGTGMEYYPHKAFVDALEAFERKHEILGASLMSWQEISIEDAKRMARKAKLTGYEWAEK